MKDYEGIIPSFHYIYTNDVERISQRIWNIYYLIDFGEVK